ncbi:pseudaminic acid synthase [Paenibacillus sp. J2TS4]|uniref:pseudaminic acid synthase n=1 Tax=Paenibacillus sp. J2TS4 TaxID=2807194 RepID=UPI001B1775E9|nr:pseudaminic acid synthase [Paenibacillus sp. J2TS4]GIP36207.1 sialic acid synthase [Paenibacillus sp. J2TS4]
MKEIRLGHRLAGVNQPPFIIAEMSANHNQSLDRALALVDEAADSGAHALKLQTYTPDLMTLDLAEGDFLIQNKDSLWKNQSLYQLYSQAYTPWEWHQPIFERCRERGILPFSTPFHPAAVDFLERLDIPFYKIASFENNDKRLLQTVAATGKPVIVSTGLSTLAGLAETVEWLRAAGCQELILLKCTSTYPASPEQSNLLTLPHMKQLFQCEVGLSDHTQGIGVALASVALGASVIEKHFTLSRSDGGVDAAFSLEPAEMKALVLESERAWKALGRVQYGIEERESSSLVFKRSLYVSRDMLPGESFDDTNLRSIRPGYGLPPKYYDVFIGKSVSKEIKAGTRISWDLLDH